MLFSPLQMNINVLFQNNSITDYIILTTAIPSSLAHLNRNTLIHEHILTHTKLNSGAGKSTQVMVMYWRSFGLEVEWTSGLRYNSIS